MIPTIEYIQLKFEKFNRLCFEGKLQPVPFKLSRSRRFLGQIRFFRKRNIDGSWHYYGFSFRINTKIDLPEPVIEDTILHEMIHYWILSGQMQDSSAHGRIFRKKMNEINLRHNRNISITHKFTSEQLDKDTELRQHLICVTRFRDGRCGVTIAVRSRLFRLWDELARIPNIAEQYWVVSTDSYFNRIPRSLTPKIYLLPAEELTPHLKSARHLIRQNNIIKVKN